MAATRRPSVECIATEVHGCLKADGAWLEKCLVTHLENLIAPGFTLIRVTVTLFACVCANKSHFTFENFLGPTLAL